MEKRISVISILVEDPDMAEGVNGLLHDYAAYIQGRLGLPCRDRDVSVICVVVDAPGNVTSALSGKLGMLKGVNTKTVTATK